MAVIQADVKRFQDTEANILAGGIIISQLGFATDTNTWWFRKDSTTYLKVAPVGEAPIDGSDYVRKDGDWYKAEGSQVQTVPITNNTGSTLNAGQVVYPVGATGVGLANAHYYEKSRLVGVVSSTISNGSNGVIYTFGEVTGFDTSSFTAGQYVYLSDQEGEDGLIIGNKPNGGGFVVLVGVIGIVDAVNGSIFVDRNVSEQTVETSDTNGFPVDQRSNTTMSINEGTRTFIINATTGSNYHFYERGTKYEKDRSDSVIFDTLEGEKWIYYKDGVLTALSTPTLQEKLDVIRKYAFIAGIYWDATNLKVVVDIQDERHGITMSWATHEYNHLSRGAQYISGYELYDMDVDGSGSNDSSAQYAVNAGWYKDEDLDHFEDGLAIGVIKKVLYLEGLETAVTARAQNNNFGVLNAPNGRLYYNQNNGGTWQLAEVPENDFCLYHVFGFNGQTVNTVSIMGQNVYPTKNSAQSGALEEIKFLSFGLDLPEMIPVATIIYQTRNSYSNAVKARIVSTDDGTDYIPWTSSDIQQGSLGALQNLQSVTSVGGQTNNEILLDATGKDLNDKVLTVVDGATTLFSIRGDGKLLSLLADIATLNNNIANITTGNITRIFSDLVDIASPNSSSANLNVGAGVVGTEKYVIDSSDPSDIFDGDYIEDTVLGSLFPSETQYKTWIQTGTNKRLRPVASFNGGPVFSYALTEEVTPTQFSVIHQDGSNSYFQALADPDDLTTSSYSGSGSYSGYNAAAAYEPSQAGDSALFEGRVVAKEIVDQHSPFFYGAVGDGVTDDTAHIASALATGVCDLQGGTFACTGVVTPLGSTIKNGNLKCHSSGGVIVTVTGKEIIQDVSFIGLTTSSGLGETGLYYTGDGSFMGVGETVISNCRFEHFDGYGIRVAKLVDQYQGIFKMDNTRVSHCEVGVWLEDRAEYNILSNCTIHNCITGIQNDGGNNNITGCNIVQNTRGVVFGDGGNPAHGVFTGNSVNHNVLNLWFLSSVTQNISCCEFYSGNVTVGHTGFVKFADCSFGTSAITLDSGTIGQFTDCIFSDFGTAVTLLDNGNWEYNNVIDNIAMTTLKFSVDIPLSNSWVELSSTYTPRVWKKGGRCIVGGLIKDGTTTDGTVCATLPVGYRPSLELKLPIVASTGTGITNTAYASILPNGEISLYGALATLYTSLDGIIFDV